MSRISQLIDRLCPEGVEYKTLGEVCTYIRGITYNKSKEINDGTTNGWKVLRANNITLGSNTLNFDDVKIISKDVAVKEKQLLHANDILICAGSGSKEHIGKVAFIRENLPYTFGGFMAVIRTTSSRLSSRYIFHILTSCYFKQFLKQNIAGAAINNLNSAIVGKFEIPVPPIEVQQEIVRILDSFTDAIDNLQRELEDRKKQFEHYRDTFFHQYQYNDIVKVKIKDFCNVLRGKRLTKKELLNEQKENTYPVFHGGIEPIGYYTKSNRPENSVMIIDVGASAGTTGFSSRKFWSSDGCFCLTHNQKFMQKFLYYYLSSKEFEIKSKVRVAGIPTLDSKVIEDIEVPSLSIDRQNTIVQQLDVLDSFINDVLPKELSLRQKQYEYYRDQLLNFKQRA